MRWNIAEAMRWPALLLLLCSSANAITDGACMQNDISTPAVCISAGGYNPETLTPDDCKIFCFKIGFDYAAVEEGKYCYCFDDGSGLTSGSTCTSTCPDGSTCGGPDGALTVWATEAISGHIIIALDPVEYAEGDLVTITVNATGTWLVDWGDGSDHAINVTTYTYTLPGEYDISAYLEQFTDTSDGVSLNIYEAPNASLICPENIHAFQNASCEFISVSHGVDYTLSRSYTEPGIPSNEYNVPGELSAMYGSIKGSATLVTPTIIATGDLIILDTVAARAGKVARIEVNAATTGAVSLYGVRPGCSSGEYCWDSGQCNAGCTLAPYPLTCSGSSSLCVTMGRCSGVACAGNSASTADLSYRFIITFNVDTANSPFTYLVDYLSADVQEGERLAIGCAVAADCSGGAADINTRNVSMAEVKDQLATYSAADVATAGSFSTSKHLVRVLVRDDPIAALSYDIKCNVASSVPTADVSTPFDATTESVVLQGFYNLMYTMTSTHLGSILSWTHTASMRCQEEVLDPTLEGEIWAPLNIDTPYPITFSKGSPLFVSLNLGPEFAYDYKDNGTDYTWNVPLLYTATGNYTLEGNATNALNWVAFTSVIHVVPIVTDTWTVTANCLCLASDLGFDVVISFPSAPNPPWTADITATYSGSHLFPPESLDFATASGGGAAVPLEKTFHVNLMTVGNHTVTFTLINEVSNTTFTTVVSF